MLPLLSLVRPALPLLFGGAVASAGVAGQFITDYLETRQIDAAASQQSELAIRKYTDTETKITDRYYTSIEEKCDDILQHHDREINILTEYFEKELAMIQSVEATGNICAPGCQIAE